MNDLHPDAPTDEEAGEETGGDAGEETGEETGPFDVEGREDIDPTSARPLAMAVDGFLSYEVSDWSGESRTLLDSLLSSNGIKHFWQGTNLSVESDREADVDAIIDEVLVSATVALDTDRDKVVYEVGEWSAAMQQSLADSLAIAEVAYEWDEAGDLVIYAEDEDVVETILEAMPDDESETEAIDDGVEVQAVLGRLWQSAVHLARDPSDTASVVSVADNAEIVEHIGLPFGFEPPVWRHLVELAVTLRDGLTASGDDVWEDDAVVEAATALKDAVRPFV